ncbi:unnamed protein product, partial [Discosporangium mesarthrocarpum]
GGRGRKVRSVEVDDMISRFLFCKDEELHTMLFGKLEEHDKLRLIRIKTPSVERFLSAKPNLLYQYHQAHRNYSKAAHLMDIQAHVDSNLDVRERLDCVLRAIAALRQCDLSSAQMVAPGWVLNHDKLHTLEDERDVLLTQERVLKQLKDTLSPLEGLRLSGRAGPDLTEELEERSRACERLAFGIANATELYNSCSRFCLWEGCLLVLQCCEANNPREAAALVRSIIWRAVPSRTIQGPGGALHTWMEQRKNDPEQPVRVDHVQEQLDSEAHMRDGQGWSGPLFEHNGWLEALMDKMLTLCRELLSDKARYVLPVDVVCLTLQDIVDRHDSNVLMVPRMLKQAGVSTQRLVDLYIGLAATQDPMSQGNAASRLRVVELLAELLSWWLQDAQLGQPEFQSEAMPIIRMDRILEELRGRLTSIDSG